MKCSTFIRCLILLSQESEQAIGGGTMAGILGQNQMGRMVAECPTPRLVITTEIKTRLGQNSQRLNELLIQMTREIDRLSGAVPRKPEDLENRKELETSALGEIIKEVDIMQGLLEELDVEIERLKTI